MTQPLGNEEQFTPPSRHMVFIDADNTLWDTDGVYAEAQLQLLTELEQALGVKCPTTERLYFVRAIDQSLAERHHSGLRYPPRMLAAAVSFALMGSDPDRATKRALSGDIPHEFTTSRTQELESAFLSRLRRNPKLLPGVRSGLKRLRDANWAVYILTEGPRTKVSKLARQLGLETLFDRILEAPKNVRLFMRVSKLGGIVMPAFMIGDQLSRDIAPAKEAGLSTIYVPSRFRPRWEPEIERVGPTFQVNRFDEAVDILLTQHADRSPIHPKG